MVGDKRIHVTLRSALAYSSLQWGISTDTYENKVCVRQSLVFIAYRSQDSNLGSGCLHHICDLTGPTTDDKRESASEESSICGYGCIKKPTKKAWYELSLIELREPLDSLDLSVLGACRQLYGEAHHILWTSNTFIFHTVASLSEFVKQLNTAQRRKLSNLELSAEIHVMADGYDPENVVTKVTVSRLLGLKHLSLLVQAEGDSYNRPYNPEQAIKKMLAAFNQLKALPLESAVVKITNTKTPTKSTFPYIKFSCELLDASAEDFRVALLDPNGALIVKREDEIAREAQKPLNKEKDLNDDLKRFKGYVEGITKNADNLKAYAAELAKECEDLEQQVTDKGDKVNKRLRARYEKKRARAAVVGKEADESAARAKKWRKQETKKMNEIKRKLDKLKRAEEKAKASKEGEVEGSL